MVDEKNEFGEEEYHFSEPQDVNVFSEDAKADAKTKAAKADDSKMRRNVLVGIGVLLLAFAVYKFLGVFFVSKPTRPLVKTPKITQTVPTKVPSFTPTAASNAPSHQFSQKISDIEARNQINSNQMSQLKSTIQTLQTSVSNLSSQISGFQNKIDSLNNKIDAQQSQIAALKKPKRVRRVVRRRVIKPVRAKINYYIQAVIPGRAWIKSSKGTTLTISEGSRVPGFGKVMMIDPHQGVIKTSSGSTIKFQPGNT